MGHNKLKTNKWGFPRLLLEIASSVILSWRHCRLLGLFCLTADPQTIHFNSHPTSWSDPWTTARTGLGLAKSHYGRPSFLPILEDPRSHYIGNKHPGFQHSLERKIVECPTLSNELTISAFQSAPCRVLKFNESFLGLGLLVIFHLKPIHQLSPLWALVSPCLCFVWFSHFRKLSSLFTGFEMSRPHFRRDI